MMQYDTDLKPGDWAELVEKHEQSSCQTECGYRFRIATVESTIQPPGSDGPWHYINGYAIRVRVLERDGKPVERCVTCAAIITATGLRWHKNDRPGRAYCSEVCLGRDDYPPCEMIRGEWPKQDSGTPAGTSLPQGAGEAAATQNTPVEPGARIPGEGKSRPAVSEQPKCIDCGAPATETIVETSRDDGSQREVLGACVYCAHRWQGVEPSDDATDVEPSGDPTTSSRLGWVDEKPQPDLTEHAWQTATSEGP